MDGMHLPGKIKIGINEAAETAGKCLKKAKE